MGERIDERSYNELSKALNLAQHTVYKRYLTELEKYPIIAPTDVLKDETAKNCLRFLKMNKFVCKKGEDIFQKLSTVYHASMSLGCNLIVMIDVKSIDAQADIYIGVRNPYIDDQSRRDLTTSFDTLKGGLNSNFPGTEYEIQREMQELVDDIFGEHTKHISSVSCVASARDKSKTQDKNFIQGLEKFIDAMQGHTYTALFIAEPVDTNEQAMIRNGYESLYSTLSSFNKSVWSYNENESTSVMESLSEGISDAITDGTSHTQAHTFNIGANLGINSSRSNTQSNSFTDSNAYTKPTKAAIAAKMVGIAGSVISCINPVAGAVVGVGGGVLSSFVGNNTHTHSTASTIASAIGKSLGINGGINIGYANTKSDTTSRNITKTTSENKTKSETETKGTGRTLQIENVNKPIEEMLKRIDEQLKRVQEGEDFGAYNCGAYFLSGKQESSLLAANTYRALMLGEGSSVESGAVNVWNGNKEEDKEKISVIKQYLSRFAHPIFAMPISETVENLADLVTYTSGTVVSGLELPMHLGLPTKSVYGLPVLEHAEFGRNIISKDAIHDSTENENKIKMGNIYHMGRIEKKSMVELDAQNLSAHTFITGSTGSGKSNTVYKILEELEKKDVKFLVVEPAKGEYKDVFGRKKNVTVYGTNPKLKNTKLLRINPFRFPKDTHVLEHMDRLVEIFNVCWPMYAAMPAILKDAIERAYITAGWDLIQSENKYNDNIFPTFSDVLIQVKQVLKESDYSADNKGDYTGALVTRIKSLTNGINGLIFSCEDIPDSQLFDENVIMDLSRVGSSETKSLIMGLLVLKLQEYRMQFSKANADTQHVTVLEEAHNLLRRTSSEQTAESSNLLGKSVEMLANSIAEMRTYGEGFIIVDQSPGLLDLSVIRNTNTKIILRLPDFLDRELVGKSAGLNDNQIVELGRLERGVASITQNDWLEPVLCKVEKYEEKNINDDFSNDIIKPEEENYILKNDIEQSLLDCIMNNEIYRKGDRVDIQKLKQKVIQSPLSATVKCRFIDYIQAGKNEEEIMKAFKEFIYEFFEAEKAILSSEEHSDIVQWSHKVADKLKPSVKEYSKDQINRILALIVNEQSYRDASYNDLNCKFGQLYQEKGGVL